MTDDDRETWAAFKRKVEELGVLDTDIIEFVDTGREPSSVARAQGKDGLYYVEII